MANTINQPRLAQNPKSEDWVYFKRLFTNYLTIVDAEDDKKRAYLLNCVGRDGLITYDGLSSPKDTYASAIERFDDFFKTKSSLLLRRKQFFEARQQPNENDVEFSCRLRRLISECDFNADVSKELLRDIYVCGVSNNALGERLLSEDASKLTFEQAVARGEALERAKTERASVSTGQRAVSSTGPVSAVQSFNSSCTRCGSKHHDYRSKDCKALSSKCHRCSKVGHYQKFCRNKPATSSFDLDSKKKSTVTAAVSAAEPDVDQRPRPTQDCFIYAGSSYPASMEREVTINGTPATILIDTGTSLNIMPLKVFQQVKSSLEPTDTQVSAWGNFKLSVLGMTHCVL